ncbi:MAG: Uma2 family endonuclease [Hyphomicrobiaceae bacterium]
MSEPVQTIRHRATQTTDGLRRLGWSLDEFERLSALGFFGGIEGPRERVELVDGEILPKRAKCGRHEWVRSDLQKELALQLGRDSSVDSVPSWRPGGDLCPEPEMIVCLAGMKPSEVPPADVLLLVEVADASLAYDTGLKARIYARLGVVDCWVVNVGTLETLVHLDPTETGYARLHAVTAAAGLAPTRLPQIRFTLGSLGFD